MVLCVALMQTDIVGLLPEEEKALKRALYASLQTTGSPDDKLKPTSKLGIKRDSPFTKSTSPRSKKSRPNQATDSSSDSTNSDSSSSLSCQWKRPECRSPSIYGHSNHSSISSPVPISSPSSPLSFGSPNSSLRLILSSPSDSPDSLSSVWSPGPSSPRSIPKKKKKLLKSKVKGQEGDKGTGKGKGKAKGEYHTVDEILLQVSQEFDRQAGMYVCVCRYATVT